MLGHITLRVSWFGSARNSVAFGSSLLFSRFGSGSQLCRLRLLVALFQFDQSASNSVAFGSSLLFSRFDQSARNSVAFGSSLLVLTENERGLTETDADGRTSNNCVAHHQHIRNTE